jgi:hypothetical protein
MRPVRMLVGLLHLSVLCVSTHAIPAQPANIRLAFSNPQAEDKNLHDVRTFVGTITQNGDQFVLNEDMTRKLCQLDDQSAVARFEDKKGTVTGTLDTLENIIHMQRIAEAGT